MGYESGAGKQREEEEDEEETDQMPIHHAKRLSNGGQIRIRG